MNAREFADAAKLSESKARQVLGQLADSGLARRFRDGRALRYFAADSDARPDLDLGDTVAAVELEISDARAVELAEGLRRTGFLGLLGGEELEPVQLLYRPVYQVVFEETVKRTGLERLLGPSEERILGTVYHHPATLHVLSMSRKRGIEFTEQPGAYASRVDDLDGVARFTDVAPGRIPIDETAWRARKSLAQVKAFFRDRFAARPTRVTPYFVPLWRLMLRQRDRGNYRVVLLDGIVGRPVEWSVE